MTKIESGALAPAERLPAETELAAHYGVTRMTVRQAMSALENEGMIVRRPGSGTYVARNAAQRRNMSRLTGFLEDMSATGREVQTMIVAQRIEPVGAFVASTLELESDAFVTYIERLRLVDSTPVIVQQSWISALRCPDLWREELVGGSLYATLRTRYQIELRRADQRLAAEAANPECAALLGIPDGSPVLRVERVTFDPRNVAVELARSWHRLDFEIAMHIER